MRLDVYALLRVALRHGKAEEVAALLIKTAQDQAEDAAEFVNVSTMIKRTLRRAQKDAEREVRRRRWLNGEDEDEDEDQDPADAGGAYLSDKWD